MARHLKTAAKTRKQDHAAERMFQAAFGRKMTAKERERFIFEEPRTLEELAQTRQDSYRFLRQT